MISDLIIH